MAPKKAPRSTVRSQFLESVLKTNISGPESLNEAQLVSAYGLTRVGPQPQSARTAQSFECQPIPTTRLDKQDDNQPIASTSALPLDQQAQPRIDISSAPTSEDELIIVQVKPKTKTTYKSRNKPQSKSNTDCNHDNCKSNPLCSTWLGQAKWEDTGQFISCHFRHSAAPQPAVGRSTSNSSDQNLTRPVVNRKWNRVVRKASWARK